MLTAAIARHLTTSHPELGLVYDADGTNQFLQELPNAPTDAVAWLFSVSPPADLSDTRVSGLQAIVRWTAGTGRARSGYQVARSILDTLHGLHGITLAPGTEDETVLVSLLADTAEPINLGDDTNGVPRWSLRFQAQTVAVTAHTIL